MPRFEDIKSQEDLDNLLKETSATAINGLSTRIKTKYESEINSLKSEIKKTNLSNILKDSNVKEKFYNNVLTHLGEDIIDEKEIKKEISKIQKDYAEYFDIKDIKSEPAPITGPLDYKSSDIKNDPDYIKMMEK